MHTARSNHAAVYHSQYFYVLREYNGRCLGERYSFAESRWEVLAALPVAGSYTRAVKVENISILLGYGSLHKILLQGGLSSSEIHLASYWIKMVPSSWRLW
jgi:hypothetical protein